MLEQKRLELVETRPEGYEQNLQGRKDQINGVWLRQSENPEITDSRFRFQKPQAHSHGLEIDGCKCTNNAPVFQAPRRDDDLGAYLFVRAPCVQLAEWLACVRKEKREVRTCS